MYPKPTETKPKQEHVSDHEKNEQQSLSNAGRENVEQRRAAPLPLGNQKRARHSESDEDTDRGLDSLIVDDKIPQRDTTKGTVSIKCSITCPFPVSFQKQTIHW